MSHDPQSPTDAADFYDDELEMDDDEEDGADCGGWINGRFSWKACTLAGTEYCDWECPNSISRPRIKARGGR